MTTPILPHWSHIYLGLPWRAHGRDRAGCDCWGLIVLVYAARGVALPSLTGDYSSRIERAEVEAVIDGQRSGPWREVGRAAIEPLDLLVFGGPWPHVGVAVDAFRMLHVMEGRCAEIASLDAPPWRARLRHVARHREMGARA